MIRRENSRSILSIGVIFVMVFMGCLSAEEKEKTRIWREKELKAQETRADLMTRADEFLKLAAPPKLTEGPYRKGKIVIAYQWADGKAEIMENNIHRMLMHAQSREEAESVLKVKCSEVPAGKYVFEDSGKEVPAFTAKCDTELIDKSIPALIYRKTFENKELKDSIKKGILGRIPEKVAASNPLKEIENFVRELPEK